MNVAAELLEGLAEGSDTSDLLKNLGESISLREGLTALTLYRHRNGNWTRWVQWGDSSLPLILDEAIPFLEASPFRIVTEPHSLRTLGADTLQAYRVIGRVATLEEGLARAQFLTRYHDVELEAIYDVGLAIAGTLDLDLLGEEILLRGISLLDARRGAIWDYRGDGYHLRQSIGGSARSFLSTELVSLLVQQNREAEGEALPKAQHFLSAPIESDNGPGGILVLADKESRNGVGPFTAGDQKTLSLLANQAAIALETARLHLEALEKERLEGEMNLAADIQQKLLPAALPVVDGWTLEAWTKSARQVGGDYYSIEASDNLQITLADVTGKGMPAALMVSNLHSALHLLSDPLPETETLMRRLNDHIYDLSASNKFITMFWGKLNPQTGHLQWANAGHNPILLIRSEGGVEELGATGLPLGLLPGSVWTRGESHFRDGDLLCVYSDGITEAASPSDEEFEMDRLKELLLANRREPLSTIRQTLEQAVIDFTEGGPQGDDETVILLRREG